MLKFCGAAAVLAWRSVAEIHYKTKCVFEWFSRQKFQNLHSLLKTFSLTFKNQPEQMRNQFIIHSIDVAQLF
jgi:hypothetical protein